MIKLLIISSTLILSTYKSFGLKWDSRCAYDHQSDSYDFESVVIFDADEFPLNICIEWIDFSKQEEELIKMAIDVKTLV